MCGDSPVDCREHSRRMAKPGVCKSGKRLQNQGPERGPNVFNIPDLNRRVDVRRQSSGLSGAQPTHGEARRMQIRQAAPKPGPREGPECFQHSGFEPASGCAETVQWTVGSTADAWRSRAYANPASGSISQKLSRRVDACSQSDAFNSAPTPPPRRKSSPQIGPGVSRGFYVPHVGPTHSPIRPIDQFPQREVFTYFVNPFS
jgi:hypothetical protein